MERGKCPGCTYGILPFVIYVQEVEQHVNLTKLKEEEMKRRHDIERKRLPKIQRNELKTKSQQYRKSLRVEKRVTIDFERELVKQASYTDCYCCISGECFANCVVFSPCHQFEDQQKKRARSEWEKLLFRQEMELEELRMTSESAQRELQQLQVCRRLVQLLRVCGLFVSWTAEKVFHWSESPTPTPIVVQHHKAPLWCHSLVFRFRMKNVTCSWKVRPPS